MANEEAVDATVAALLKHLEENGEVSNTMELAAKLSVDHQEVRLATRTEGAIGN
jgi:hypothetical protein